MLGSKLLMCSNSTPKYIANAVDNGGLANLRRGGNFTGCVDGSKGILAFSIRINSGDATTQVIYTNSANSVYVYRNNTNHLFVILNDAGFNNHYQITTTPTYTTSASWLRVVMSWDMGNATKKFQVYINESQLISGSGFSVGGNSATIWNVGYSNTNHFIYSDSNGGSPCKMCFSEFYLNTAEFIDLTVPANLQKFFKNGKPVDKGANGQLPTGNSPLVYLKSPAATGGVNSGTGGNLSIFAGAGATAGTLSVASTSPTD